MTASVGDAEGVFNRMEERIDRQMLELEAREELRDDHIEKELNEMRKDSEVEDELAALKAKMKK